jgi:YD repeat-containing protein
MDANGGNLIRVTNNGSNDDHPRWSPNGSKILFQSDRDDLVTANRDVYVMNADGTGQTRLTTDAADDCNAIWSPDGNKIVFQSLRNGTYYQVYTMNADGTSQTNLSNGSAADYQPSWSPDGSKIAFASERDHAEAPSIYVMNANGSSQTRLTFSSELVRDEQPAWSRNGTKIAFVSTRDGNKDLYVMNADGSNPLKLTNTLENDDSPYWSPDGTQIIFRSERERDSSDPIQQLWMMNADGNNQTLIAGTSFGDYSPSWNASGNQPPVASSGGPYSGVVAQNVPFSGGGSFDPDGTINSYSWSFGDGGTGSGVSLTHTYAAAGTYPVTLTVTDNLGAQTSATTTTSITTAASEQYLANFNQAALARAANGNESSYWNDILRAAFPNGQSSMLLAVRELGKTLFESSDYAARNRDNHWYVYDLYKTYLMREPDAPGWAFWESVCNSNGRENVRRAFDECGEFAGIVSTLTPNGAASSTVSSLASARVDPFNQPGSGLTARDAEWSVSLLSLPGRAGLDLGLSLSYSSMVWTRSGPYLYFDEDNGWPSPGFRLGSPTIQEKLFDAQAGRNVYLLISGGSRVSLRQLGTSNVYEAADSSYLQLIDSGGSLLVRTTDGTQLTYQSFNSEWRCTQIKDRNGNYISVNYDWLGHITTIIDTLARTITFNYDTNANLLSITQSWTVNGVPATHTWASFGWGTKTLQPSFTGVLAVGAANPSTIPVLNQVGLDDGSRYTFEYNAAGQVNPIRSFRSDNIERAYTAYDYDTTVDDCPRLIDTHVWAQNWTGINGVPMEVATLYGDPGDGSHTVTTSDGTLYKEFYGTGWQRGLTTQTEVWSAGVKQKWTSNTWTQDNTGVNYQTNPRVTETNIDDGSNHRRVTTTYTTSTLPSGASCSLPSDMREYAGDASTVLRRTHVDYRMNTTLDASYLDRHIIGLVKEQTLYEVSGGTETLMSKVGFAYDEAGSLQGTDAPVRHDNDNYGTTFVTGRANLSSVKRYDATDISQFTVSSMKYNTSGAVVSTTDPLPNHTTTVSYVDSFSDGNNGRNTLAYPKTVTDADGYSSTITYNFDFGAVTQTQTPQPNTTQNLPGPVQTFAYDAAGRIEKATSTTNGAYVRYVYGPNYSLTFSTVNNLADEAYSNTVFDGIGRAVVAASNHPGSMGGYRAVNTIYDRMGRAVKQSNPTETNDAWAPAGDDLPGWLYTQQSYDWKGRPLVTTNTDGTTKEASYTGCGCAGGEVVTLTDEGTVDGGVAKRRQQKIYSDVLGRTVKTEILNWQGGSPYSTTINSYNARDQVRLIRQFDPANETIPSDPNDLSCPYGACQQTNLIYDGYGRLKTKHVPQQDTEAVTTYNYNPDDTVLSVVDARGATCTYGYNNRHQLTSVSHVLSGLSTISLGYVYDAAGNRKSMTDQLGHVDYLYDQLSRLQSENRFINGISNPLPSADGAYKISYSYNLANDLASVTDAFGSEIDYGHDTTGRLTSVTSPANNAYAGVTTFASNVLYRAWGAVRAASFGNGTAVTVPQFNSKMLATQFRLAAGSTNMLREDYSYFDDGRLNQLTDLDDTPGSNPPETVRFMSRSYAYDLKGRITGAGGTNMTPFVQYYSYDQFDNLTARSGTYLWQSGQSDSATYSDNRRVGWTYDADGRLKISPATSSSNQRNWTYDAAGELTSTAETAGSTTTTLNQTYDGDGQVVYESVTGSNPNSNYLIHSAVLAGATLTKLDASGNKTMTYVPAGGLVFPQQTKDNNQPVVRWIQRDPQGQTEMGGGGYLGLAAYDPLGNYVPLMQHAPAPTPPSAMYGPGYGSASSSFSNGNNLTTGCKLDGVAASCDSLMRAIGNGGVQPGSIIISTTGGLADIANAGWGGVALSTRTQNRKWINDPLPKSNILPTLTRRGDAPKESSYYDPYSPDNEGRPGHWETSYEYNYVTGNLFGGDPSPDGPQNPAPQIDQKKYDGCAKLLGKSPAPSKLATEAILWTSSQEGTNATLIAVTWAKESGFDFNPVANARDDGGFDVGPLQTSTTYFGKDRFVNTLSDDAGEVMGTFASETARFNGNPYLALRWGARALNDGAGRKGRPKGVSALADMAGIYRSGSSRTGPYRTRVNEFNALSSGYDAFFNCLRK